MICNPVKKIHAELSRREENDVVILFCVYIEISMELQTIPPSSTTPHQAKGIMENLQALIILKCERLVRYEPFFKH